MRILFAHNRYIHRGGEDESREQEKTLLLSRGHDVLDYVVDNREVKQNNFVLIGLRSVWSRDQYEKVRAFLRETRPDILKVDNYFPILSPAIFDAAKSLNIPTVLSVRNYRLVCPSANLFRDEKICDACVGHRLAFPAIRHRCYRGSYLQTSSVVLSTALGHLRGTWTRSVDRFVAVSEFVKGELVRGGYAEEKISVKPNFIKDTGIGDGSGRYALYVGRLAEEKGIRTLMSAWQKVGVRVPLKVIGDGPLKTLVQHAERTTPGIEYLGWRSIDEVCDQVGRASMLIFPSEWLEPFGRSIVESYSKGTPVVAGETAPMRDMIVEGETGLLFRPGDSDHLAEQVAQLISDQEAYREMRRSARQRYLKMYSENSNYSQMMEIFERVRSN